MQNSMFKPPALKIPQLSENKNEFKKWRQEIRAYLNLYDQCDKILMEEEKEPAPKSPEDYLDGAGNQIANYDQVKITDDLNYGKALETFRNKSRFISTVLIQSCMENKKASHLIQNVSPGDWQSIWRTLLKYYHPMGANNKVELFRKFSAMTKSNSESIMEFVQRVDSELTDLKIYGVDIPDEISINVLQQGAGHEYDTFIRLLIHQKATYEVIRDELINYDFHATPTSTNSKIETVVNKVQFNTGNTSKFANFSRKPWKSQKRSVKFNNQFTRSNTKITCSFCGKVGHSSKECRSRIYQSKSIKSVESIKSVKSIRSISNEQHQEL